MGEAASLICGYVVWESTSVGGVFRCCLLCVPGVGVIENCGDDEDCWGSVGVCMCLNDSSVTTEFGWTCFMRLCTSLEDEVLFGNYFSN